MPVFYEKYHFDDEYQDLLLACIIKHPEKFLNYGGVINSGYFEGIERISTARALLAYWKENARLPVKEMVREIVHRSIKRSDAEKSEDSIAKYLARILEEIPTNDYPQVAARVVEWAKHRALYNAIAVSSLHFQEKKIPPDNFISLFEEALAVGLNLEDFGYFLGPDPNDIENVVAKYTQVGMGVPTGYPQLDSIMSAGGFQPGWLIAVVAPPKRYKTTFVINLAMNMTRRGKPVFYYPCEISQEDAAIRALCNLTGLDNKYIREHPGSFTQIAMTEANKQFHADLLIKGYPSKGATISGDIASHAMAVQRQFGINPGAIIIDFAETVSVDVPKGTSDARAQAQIYIEARKLGHRMKCPVILPDRCNRETVEAVVPSMTSFQGAFEKAGIVDMAIGLCADDIEYQENKLRFFVFLFRHGEAGVHIRGTVNPLTQRITMDARLEWSQELADKEEARNRSERRKKGRYNARTAVPAALTDST
jgi:replicative DNA helicase